MSPGDLGALAAGGFVWLLYILLAGLSSGGAVQRIARKHEKALALTWTQTVYPDQYGGFVYDAWQRECRRFIEAHVAPELGWLGRRWLFGRGWDRAHRLVGEIALARAAELDLTASVPTDPLAYEAYCAEILRRASWVANLTKRSGDQGADIIAERGAFRITIQAKLYGQPVGNGAVQEAIAAQHFYRANAAAVVSNATFTPAAHQLAASAGVLLLHDSQLAELGRLCGLGEAERIA